MNFNIKLKNLRQLNNMYQKDIAKKLNISTDTYGAWERGTNEPPLETIKKLADLYNVTIDYLFDRETEDGQIIIQEPELPNDEKKLLNNYRNLPNELKTMTQEYVKTLNNLNNEFYNIENKKKA